MTSIELSRDPNEDPDVNLVRIDDLARVRRWLSTQARFSRSSIPLEQSGTIPVTPAPTSARESPGASPRSASA